MDHGKKWPLTLQKIGKKTTSLYVIPRVKYPFHFEMSKRMVEATIPKFQQLFAQYGPARTLLTDNEQPFSSEKFTAYMMQQQVQHII